MAIRLIAGTFLLFILLVSCQPVPSTRTEMRLEEVLLMPDDVGLEFSLRDGNTGKRIKADYELEDSEWEEFGWVDGYKVTFENQKTINESYTALFNYNSRYLHQNIMFEEYKETRYTDQKFTVLNAPIIGEDSIAFVLTYTEKTPAGEVLEWTEVDVTFIKHGMYENIGILQLSTAADVQEALGEVLQYARMLEGKVDAAYAKERG